MPVPHYGYSFICQSDRTAPRPADRQASILPLVHKQIRARTAEFQHPKSIYEIPAAQWVMALWSVLLFIFFVVLYVIAGTIYTIYK